MYSPSESRATSYLLVASLTALLLTSGLRAYVAVQSDTYAHFTDEAYIQPGHRFPSVLPRPVQPTVVDMINGSTLYPLEDDERWASVVPPGHGFIRMGDEGKPFSIAMAHQLHCLNGIRFAYVAGRDNYYSDPEKIEDIFHHANHCFDLLRQSITCNADGALVPTKPDGSRGSLYGTTHRCRDWTQLVSFSNENQAFWKGVPLPPPSEDGESDW